MSGAIAAEPYSLVVGHWKEETYAIHGPSGHIASGVQPAAASALVVELNRLTAELERSRRECEGLREQLTWAVNNPDDPAYWLHSAKAALSAGEKDHVPDA